MMSPETVGKLLDQHGATLVLYARQWCASPEDVVQEAFLKLARLAEPPGKILPWLYRVVRNLAHSAGRSSRRRRKHESAAAGQNSSWFEPNDTARLDGNTAAAALAGLPAVQREIIVAHLWGELTFEEIAELTGVSASTAHRHYQAGLTALRGRLETSCLKRNMIGT